jgi:hypothetical protein
MARNELADIVSRVHLRALKAAEKALAQPGDTDYDAKKDVRWADRPISVAAGLMLAAKALEHASATEITDRQLGIMLVRERIKDPAAWEALAGKVDAAITGETTATVPLALPSGDLEGGRDGNG